MRKIKQMRNILQLIWFFGVVKIAEFYIIKLTISTQTIRVLTK